MNVKTDTWKNGEDREFGKRDGLPRVLADVDGGNFFTIAAYYLLVLLQYCFFVTLPTKAAT